MNLSDHDLRQIDENYLNSLSENELREVSKKLCGDLKEVRTSESEFGQQFASAVNAHTLGAGIGPRYIRRWRQHE